ncbi:MAG: TetR/AcrR family transcriptional regulator [Acidimicrobiia bacterium]
MTVVAAEPTTRDRLVAAAIKVFVEQGYEQARVQDIARAAGLTTGAIYANFRDKRELLLAAIAHRSAAEVETLLHAAETTPPRDLLAALGSRVAFRDDDRPLLLDAVVASERDPALAALLRDALGERHARIADLVDQGKSDRTIDEAIDTDVLTRFCLTVALGSLVVRALALPQPDPDHWASLIERLLDAAAPAEDPR